MKERLLHLWRRLQLTLPLRAWQRYGDLRGNRLAGAATFYGFVSLFPLLVLGAALASAVAGPDGVRTMQEIVDANLPGMDLDVSRFHERAGALSIISVGTLLFTGLGWVDATRAAIRAMWGLDDQPGNVVVRKAVDVAALAGLGVVIALSWGLSVFIGAFTADVLDLLGLSSGFADFLLTALVPVLSVGVSSVLFAYLLSGLPRIPVPPGRLAAVSLLGAVVFEVLKQFLVSFVAGPGSRDAYAAFATPLALLAWIYLVTRLLMVLAALNAESAIDSEKVVEPVTVEIHHTAGVPDAGFVAPTTPSARQERAAGLAAGSILGAAGLGLALLGGRAVRTAASVFRRGSDGH